jgi:hypothetical protein
MSGVVSGRGEHRPFSGARSRRESRGPSGTACDTSGYGTHDLAHPGGREPDPDERFELLFDIFVDGLARRAATPAGKPEASAAGRGPSRKKVDRVTATVNFAAERAGWVRSHE